MMLNVPKFDFVLEDVFVRYNSGGFFPGSVMQVESFTRALGGVGVVASGFELTTGASWGGGGGVAR